MMSSSKFGTAEVISAKSAEVHGQTKDALQSRCEEMFGADFRLFQRCLLCTWTVVLLLGLHFVGFS